MFDNCLIPFRTWRTRRQLTQLDCTNMRAWSWKNYKTLARIVSIYDGDTMTIVFPYKHGNEKFMTVNIRILGIDTPEMKPRGKSEEETTDEKKRAVAARDRLCKLVGFQIQQSQSQRPAFVNIELVKPDKYGTRVLGHVYNMQGENVSEVLIKEGLGIPYDGGKKL